MDKWIGHAGNHKLLTFEPEQKGPSQLCVGSESQRDWKRCEEGVPKGPRGKAGAGVGLVG